MKTQSRVWIVDREASIRWVLEQALIGAGLSVQQFERSEYMLDAMVNKVPDLMMFDLGSPQIDGLETLKTIQNQHPAISIIAMTTSPDFDIVELDRCGTNLAYLSKPFDLDEALDLVRRMLTRRTDWQAALSQAVQERLNIGSTNLLIDFRLEFEMVLLQTTLAFTGGRKREAARRIGWGRNTLARKIKELNID